VLEDNDVLHLKCGGYGIYNTTHQVPTSSVTSSFIFLRCLLQYTLCFACTNFVLSQPEVQVAGCATFLMPTHQVLDQAVPRVLLTLQVRH
jgi:hypothetical protein